MGQQNTVDAYIADLDGWQAQVAAELDRIVMEVAPQANKVIKWGNLLMRTMGCCATSRYLKPMLTLVFFGVRSWMTQTVCWRVRVRR